MRRSSNPMRRMSASKSARMPRYRATVEEARKKHLLCARCRLPEPLEPHHTHGRVGDNLFRFLLLCRKCHQWINDNTKAAKSGGWIVDSVKHAKP